jgi:hypothetical protein
MPSDNMDDRLLRWSSRSSIADDGILRRVSGC